MPIRLRRSLNILPGLRVNLSRSGASVSVGVRGAHVTLGPKGTRTTVGLPGTDLSYAEYRRTAPPQAALPRSGWGAVLVLLVVVLLVALVR